MAIKDSDYLLTDVKILLDSIETLKLPGRSKLFAELKGQLGKFKRAAQKHQIESEKQKSKLCSESGKQARKILADSYF
ncbi:hypothetical protein [Polynucleobacter sp.]|uniref:hypothetical protein n=1 Tax=Polynucleobacter sp. TaxID=2029855 RepID=UPI003F696730